MKKGFGKNIRVFFTRRILVAVLILAQLILLVGTVFHFQHLYWLQVLLSVISAGTAFHLISRPEKSAFKLSLCFFILLFPLFGGSFYWIFHFQTSDVGFRKRLSRIQQNGKDAFGLSGPPCSSEPSTVLEENQKLIHYLENSAGFPLCKDTQTDYFPSGEDMLQALLADIDAAEHSVFMEYFIIEDGVMWSSILTRLKQKAQQGVCVRIVYDDLGCLLRLPADYPDELRKFGIECKVFNRFRPFLTNIQNNRDHRKIFVIDGKIAYTGGINLADEYINEKLLFGHWKDTAVRLCGSGAWSFAVMFLQMWEFLTEEKQTHERFLPCPVSAPDNCQGWVQPYTDSPMDKEDIAEHIFLHIIENAHRYVYITTPYLVIGDELIAALTFSAKSGVDVRIITPAIPDKKFVHFTSRSYYRELIAAGVKVYEYTPGFIHAKSIVSDDHIASIGTVNMDFRSLYLHMECGVCLYGTNTVQDIKDDILETVQKSHRMEETELGNGIGYRFWHGICRLFAPLM